MHEDGNGEFQNDKLPSHLKLTLRNDPYAPSGRPVLRPGQRLLLVVVIREVDDINHRFLGWY